MLKQRLRLFLASVMLFVLCAAPLTLCGGFAPRAAGRFTNAPPAAAAASFAQGINNDFFTSPAGIFIDGEGDARRIYAADKYMGIIVYGSGGDIEKIFKREGREYKKAYVYNDFIITLEDGGLAFFDTNGEARPQSDYIGTDPDGLCGQTFADIALDGSTLYCLSGNYVYRIGITVSGGNVSLATQGVYGGGLSGLRNISSVAVSGGDILLAAGYDYEKALYLYDAGAGKLTAVSDDFAGGINDITVFDNGGGRYAAVAHQNSLTALTLPEGRTYAVYIPSSLTLGGGGIRSASFVYAQGEELYVCDSASKAVAVFALPELAFKNILFASSGDEPGRLNRPESVCVWEDKLFIADSLNGRIQVWDRDGAVSVFGNSGGGALKKPTAVTVDALGRIFVADDNARVVKFDSDYKYISSAQPEGAYITGITAAADGVIYASDSLGNRILAADAGDDALDFRRYSGADEPVSICASLNYTALYILKKDGGIARIDKDAAGGAPSVSDINKGQAALGIENITAFTSDCANNIIALSDDPVSETFDVIKLSPDAVSGAYSETARARLETVYEYAANDIRHMAFSPVSGEVFLTDVRQSRVYPLPAATAAEIGAVPFSDTERPAYESGTPLAAGEYRVAELNSQTPLYAVPLVSKADEILPRGTNLAVLKRNLEGNGYYSFVYLPSLNKAGYVLKALLGDYLPEDALLFDEGRIFNDGTPVYKFPSRLAPRVGGPDGGLALPKEKKVKLVPYAKAADAGPDKWYCIELDGGGIGFVSSLNVANYKYQPTKTILATNADIVKSAADGGAFLFEKEGDEYVPMTVPPLKDGARVKVVGSFKANSKYTEIIYQDADLGLIQGHILTKYIKYDTATNLQFIMLALLIILAAAACAAVYIFQRKKSRVKR